MDKSDFGSTSRQPKKRTHDIANVNVSKLSDILGFAVSFTTTFSPTEYRFLFPAQAAGKSTSELKSHYTRNFVPSSRYNLFFFKIPVDIDIQFLCSFYNVDTNDDASVLCFLKKYLNMRHIIHNPDLQCAVNLGFMYSLYRPVSAFNLNRMYDFYKSVKPAGSILTNSRQLLVAQTPKDTLPKYTQVIWINLDDQETPLLIHNLSMLLKLRQLVCVLALFEFDDTAEVTALRYFLNNMLLSWSKESGTRKYTCIDDVRSLPGYVAREYDDDFSKCCLGLHCITSMHGIASDQGDNTFIFLFASLSKIYLVDDISDLAKRFVHLKNNIMSITDYYSESFEYDVSGKILFLKGNVVQALTALHQKKPKKLRKYLWKMAASDKLCWPVAFFSVDDFLPYLVKSFNTINLFKKTHLLHRLGSPAYHRSATTFFSTLYRARQIGPTLNVRVHIILHLGHVSKDLLSDIRNMFSDPTHANIEFNLIITVSRYKLCTFAEDARKFQESVSATNALARAETRLQERTNECSCGGVCYEQEIRDTLVSIFSASLEKSQITVLFVDNIGADLYPFLCAFDHLKRASDTTPRSPSNLMEIVIKLHTKRDTLWRKDLEYPIFRQLDTALQVLASSRQLGCVASGNWILDNDLHANDQLLDFLKRTGLEPAHAGCKFVGGSVFLIRKNILDVFFEKTNADATSEKPYFSGGYHNLTDHRHIDYAHVWERILSGVSTSLCGSEIFGL